MKTKRFWVLLLSFVLIFTAMPLTAFADTIAESGGDAPIAVSDGEKAYDVESTGLVQYAVEGYIFNIRGGIYKVIVPEDAKSITITCNENITTYDSASLEIEGENDTNSIEIKRA